MENNIKKLIEQMFYNHMGTTEYYKESLKHRSEEYNKAYERFTKTFEDEEIFNGAIAEREEFSFKQGFKFALNFLSECNQL